MDLDHALALFDAQVRVAPNPSPGVRIERADGVVRLVGQFNYVAWWDARADAAALVAGQAAHFRARAEALMWRVYGHDQPKDLGDILARHGFQSGPPGTLLLFDIANQMASAPPAQAEVRRARTPADLEDFAAAADQAFGDHQASERRAAYASRLDDPGFALFVAYVDGEPVASARLEVSGSFGQMFGGGVAPAHRGRGAYRALVQSRVAEARRMGLRYLATEARETSRPTLERLGFVPAGPETTWVLPAT